MPSTEFLLYLVIIIFVLYAIMNYNKEQTHEDIQYKYIPVYNSRSESESKRSEGSCNNPRCIQSGRCVCGNNQNQNVSINNVSVNEESWGGGYGGYGGYGRGGPGPGPVGRPGGPGLGPIGGLSGPGGPGGPGIPPPIVDPGRQFDIAATEDPFTPPFRRSYYDDYVLPMGLLPTFSRSPGRFRKIGTAVANGVANDSKYKYMNVMGRERYSNREYQYYIISTDVHDKIKIFIETNGKEMNDGDIFSVPQIQGFEYTLMLDKDLSPLYDPYFI
jgi:hypothetical protein